MDGRRKRRRLASTAAIRGVCATSARRRRRWRRCSAVAASGPPSSESSSSLLPHIPCFPLRITSSLPSLAVPRPGSVYTLLCDSCFFPAVVDVVFCSTIYSFVCCSSRILLSDYEIWCIRPWLPVRNLKRKHAFFARKFPWFPFSCRFYPVVDIICCF